MAIIYSKDRIVTNHEEGQEELPYRAVWNLLPSETIQDWLKWIVKTDIRGDIQYRGLETIIKQVDYIRVQDKLVGYNVKLTWDAINNSYTPTIIDSPSSNSNILNPAIPFEDEPTSASVKTIKITHSELLDKLNKYNSVTIKGTAKLNAPYDPAVANETDALDYLAMNFLGTQGLLQQPKQESLKTLQLNENSGGAVLDLPYNVTVPDPDTRKAASYYRTNETIDTISTLIANNTGYIKGQLACLQCDFEIKITLGKRAPEDAIDPSDYKDCFVIESKATCVTKRSYTNQSIPVTGDCVRNEYTNSSIVYTTDTLNDNITFSWLKWNPSTAKATLIPYTADEFIMSGGLTTGTNDIVDVNLYNVVNKTDLAKIITPIKADIATNTSKISTNTGNIATNTGNITTNTTDISANKTEVATLKAQVNSQTSNIATNTGNIATNKANIATLKTEVDAQVSKIAANTSNIATNTSHIATNASDIATNKTNIAATTAQITANKTNIATNTGNISANATKITSLEQADVAIGSDVKALRDRSIQSAGYTQSQNTISGDRKGKVMYFEAADGQASAKTLEDVTPNSLKVDNTGNYNGTTFTAPTGTADGIFATDGSSKPVVKQPHKTPIKGLLNINSDQGVSYDTASIPDDSKPYIYTIKNDGGTLVGEIKAEPSGGGTIPANVLSVSDSTKLSSTVFDLKGDVSNKFLGIDENDYPSLFTGASIVDGCYRSGQDIPVGDGRFFTNPGQDTSNALLALDGNSDAKYKVPKTDGVEGLIAIKSGDKPILADDVLDNSSKYSVTVSTDSTGNKTWDLEKGSGSISPAEDDFITEATVAKPEYRGVNYGTAVISDSIPLAKTYTASTGDATKTECLSREVKWGDFVLTGNYINHIIPAIPSQPEQIIRKPEAIGTLRVFKPKDGWPDKEASFTVPDVSIYNIVSVSTSYEVIQDQVAPDAFSITQFGSTNIPTLEIEHGIDPAPSRITITKVPAAIKNESKYNAIKLHLRVYLNEQN